MKTKTVLQNKKQKTITKAGGLVMKTKNNVQQAILKSLAVVFSLALVSITVNAQDFLKSIYENNGFKDIALAMVEVKDETSNEISNADAFTTLFEVESEEALDVENWMVNESSFGTFVSIEEENDNPLELENWMTDNSYFDITSTKLIEETENELAIEDWMVNDDLFTTTGNDEQPLKVEDWMVSKETWTN